MLDHWDRRAPGLKPGAASGPHPSPRGRRPLASAGRPPQPQSSRGGARRERVGV